MDKSRVAGVLLAGGRSQRMKVTHKCLIEVGGMTLLEHAKRRARNQVSALLLNVNGDRTPFMRFGLPMKADSIEDFAGPLAGILTALEWARDDLPGVQWVASFATDSPLFPEDLVEGLAGAMLSAGADMACAASGNQIYPVFGLWPIGLADDMRNAMTNHGVRKIDEYTSRYKVAFGEWAPEGDPFVNINEPEDLAAFEKKHAKKPTGTASKR